MSFDMLFSKENLNECLSELGKEFRKLNGKKMSAEITLIGGASILTNYGFRQMTNDIDAVITASSAMKEAINHVGDRLNLPNGWLNTDFRQTSSFSQKIAEVSVYYKTFSNVLIVRTVNAEYLIAMKLMSGREYKNDLSDIVGILNEHQNRRTPITLEEIRSAVVTLYGKWEQIPESSRKFIDSICKQEHLDEIYKQYRESELEARNALVEFDKKYPGELKEDNLITILEQAKARKTRPSVCTEIDKFKVEMQNGKRESQDGTQR